VTSISDLGFAQLQDKYLCIKRSALKVNIWQNHSQILTVGSGNFPSHPPRTNIVCSSICIHFVCPKTGEWVGEELEAELMFKLGRTQKRTKKALYLSVRLNVAGLPRHVCNRNKCNRSIVVTAPTAQSTNWGPWSWGPIEIAIALMALDVDERLARFLSFCFLVSGMRVHFS